MKNKMIWPIILGTGTTAVFVVAELFGLINQLSHLNSRMNSELSKAAYSHTVYRMLIGIVLISVIVYMMINRAVHQVTGPIYELTMDAKKFNEDKYRHQLRDYDIEEIQELAKAFDDMGEALSGSIRKLKHQNRKLETMLGALDEGIIVIDREGYIEECNQLAKEMLRLKEGKRGTITQFLRDERFRELVEDVWKNGIHRTVELSLEERIVYLTMVPIGKKRTGQRASQGDEYLLVIKDVTKLRALEEMRYQFVSNVSHELKTPLTSIQGFVETLQGGAIENPEVAHRFLNIIDIETKRLYRLIQDVLFLSEIENMEKQNYGNVEVSEVIRSVVEMLEEEATHKEIKLTFNHTKDLYLSNVSEDHMRQLMMNFISNAIKYSDHGEVTITTWEEYEKAKISIRDTGIGIPEESLPLIFQRFYTVDKGRSRKSGGTGLGLSIVKHIAQLYDAEIDVQSKIGEGSIFTLSFPLS